MSHPKMNLNFLIRPACLRCYATFKTVSGRNKHVRYYSLPSIPTTNLCALSFVGKGRSCKKTHPPLLLLPFFLRISQFSPPPFQSSALCGPAEVLLLPCHFQKEIAPRHPYEQISLIRAGLPVCTHSYNQCLSRKWFCRPTKPHIHIYMINLTIFPSYSLTMAAFHVNSPPPGIPYSAHVNH